MNRKENQSPRQRAPSVNRNLLDKKKVNTLQKMRKTVPRKGRKK